MNTSNVADWSMAFYAYHAVLAIMNDWLRSAVPTVGALGERRGFCPSCGARRMAESAALLVDEVLPHEPMRQWVLSFPFQLSKFARFMLTRLRSDRSSLSRCVTIFIQILRLGQQQVKMGNITYSIWKLVQFSNKKIF